MLFAVIWLILIIVFIIVEISTAAYISFWFIIGSIVAMLVSLVTSSTITQIAVFLFVSLFSLIILRPFALKYAKPKAKSNVEALVDKEGIVTEQIYNTANKGRISIIGQDWAAKSADDKIIDEGKKVIVTDITGNKLIVREVE